MRNEEVIYESKIATKVSYKRFGLRFAFVVRFSTARVIEVKIRSLTYWSADKKSSTVII